MSLKHTWTFAIAVVLPVLSLGAAPAPPSFNAVESAIRGIREQYVAPDQPPATDWEAWLTGLEQDLKAYTGSTREDDRLRALGHLYVRRADLGQRITWGPAATLASALDGWLAPRIKLAWAMRQAEDAVRGLPPAPTPEADANRKRWLDFLGEDLVGALHAYEAAPTVADRARAFENLEERLGVIETGHQNHAWGPSLNLAGALVRVFSQTNIEAIVDFPTAASYMARQIVEPDVLYREGQYSYISPGAYLGFGLLPSDDGIAFFNKQIANSVTPIRGFNQQVASADPRGRRLTKLYSLAAETRSTNVNTATTILRPSGIQLIVDNVPQVAFNVGLTPVRGGGFGRLVASLVGYGRERIRQQVYENAYPRVKEGAIRGSKEESAERSAAAQARLNAQLAAYLVGNNAAVYDRFAVTNLALGSRPELVYARGLIRDRAEQLWSGLPGADAPQPPQFISYEPGVTADVHLPSVATNLLGAVFAGPEVQQVTSLMLETRDSPAGAAPSEGLKVTRNIDFGAFSEAVDRFVAANDPAAGLLRVRRPEAPPMVSVDAAGNLVLLVKDLAVDIAAPPAAPRLPLGGTKARIYRLTSPMAEVVVQAKLETSGPGVPPVIAVKVLSLDAGPGAAITAIDRDEAAGVAQNALVRAALLGTLQSRLQAREVRLPLNKLDVPGFALARISPLDPSGWVRVVLTRVR